VLLRIKHIDGLRGLAILSVVFFHGYSRWNEIEPYRQTPILRNLFSYGFLGVELFFMISGFVIFMSLQHKKSLGFFLWSRWLRLAPAMLIASGVIFLTSSLIPERPIGKASVGDLLPGILLIDPGILNKILGTSVKSLDGAFWSIYVEAKFYVVAAMFFFILRDSKLKSIVILYLTHMFNSIMISSNIQLNFFDLIDKYLTILGAQYFGWFAIGIYTYIYIQEKKVQDKLILFILSLTNILLFNKDSFNPTLILMLTILMLVWFGPFIYPSYRRFLESKIVLFFGFISYPLYLLHQNLITGMTIEFYNLGLRLPGFLFPVTFLIPIIFVSFSIAKLEPMIRNVLSKIFFATRGN
jgi:peptidoglycan/LPS O-acetylase OafA/YrhL